MSVYGGPIIEESVSATTLSPSVDLGQRRVWKGEEYVYCYNGGGSSLMANYGAVIQTTASGYTIAGTGITDSPMRCVGAVKHATIVTAAYGWVMTKGFLNLYTANSVLAAGNVAIGAAVGVADKGIAFGLASGPATNNVCGMKLLTGATVSAGTFYAFINTGM